jgi:NAD(P)H-flavin reductase/ferredoxin
VPRARTLPPRALALGLIAMLLVLSLVKPAVSQGAADFATQPRQLDLDWFYLALYPLVTRGHAAALWIAVAGATVLFALVPWLPPLKRGAVRAWQLTVHPGNRTVPVRPAETLLDAGLRGGVPLPFECRSGGCGICRAKVLIGEIDPGVYQPGALTAAARARGDALLCCATALSDIEIELEEGAAAREEPLPVYHASVERLERLAPDVMALSLRLHPGTHITYRAGQYINILLEDGARRAFSFTEQSGTTDRIELHVRRIPGGRFTTHVFERLRVGDRMRFEGPLGETVLRTGDQPMIFVAGATGFAPVKSLLEEAFARGESRPLYLYWGVRKRRDLYLLDLPQQWERRHANFHFVPVLSEAGPEDAWNGRTGLVHEALLEDFPDLAGHLVYACGSMQMVEHARPALLAHGLDEASCLSDAFTPQLQKGAPSGHS